MDGLKAVPFTAVFHHNSGHILKPGCLTTKANNRGLVSGRIRSPYLCPERSSGRSVRPSYTTNGPNPIVTQPGTMLRRGGYSIVDGCDLPRRQVDRLVGLTRHYVLGYFTRQPVFVFMGQKESVNDE